MVADLWLRFEQSRGETIVRPEKQQPPWRMIRAFRTASGEALAHLHNVSGGVLDPDDLRLRIEVGQNALAQVTTTGATRVYRSRSRDAVAAHSTRVSIAEGGMLEYLPDPLILYAGSRFRQTAVVDLGPGATLFWWETITPGREALGEVFVYERLANSFELRAGGRTLALEQFAIEPNRLDPRSPARIGDFRYVSTFYICQPGRESSEWLELESQLAELAERLSRAGEVLWGVSALASHGLVVRGAAQKGRDLTASLVTFWSMAKWALCGRVAVVPRKIY